MARLNKAVDPNKSFGIVINEALQGTGFELVINNETTAVIQYAETGRMYKLLNGDFSTVYIGTKGETIELGKVSQLAQNGTLQPGQYILYNGNGYTDWRVLYANENKVEIISKGSVETKTLKGKDDYNNMISILNEIANNYKNDIYANSARCIGSDLMADTNKKAYEDYPKYSYIQTYALNMPAGDSNFSLDLKAMQDAGINSIETSYWLASRRVGANASNANFCGRYVNISGSMNDVLFNLTSTGNTTSSECTHGVRPVIAIKSDVKIIGGEGTEQDPWILE